MSRLAQSVRRGRSIAGSIRNHFKKILASLRGLCQYYLCCLRPRALPEPLCFILKQLLMPDELNGASRVLPPLLRQNRSKRRYCEPTHYTSHYSRHPLHIADCRAALVEYAGSTALICCVLGIPLAISLGGFGYIAKKAACRSCSETIGRTVSPSNRKRTMKSFLSPNVSLDPDRSWMS